MKLYAVGTTLTNLIGYCKDAVNKVYRRVTGKGHGTFKMLRTVDVPSIVVVSWVGNKSVHVLVAETTDAQALVRATTVVMRLKPFLAQLSPATTIVSWMV